MAQEAKGIRYQSEHFATVQGLMHSVNEQSLMAKHRKQSGKKAAGIDGVSKVQYDGNAKENIQRLVERMKKFQYKPLPVRRTYISKANGKLRPLGIPAYEDRLVQGVMANALNEVYEPRFLDCSYGFRPGRSAHDVVRYINQMIMTHKVNYVLEADINTWHFGYKAHIGVDKDSGLVHTVKATPANVHDVSEASKLLTGEEEVVYGDSGYLGAGKREDAIVRNKSGRKVKYKINRRPSQVKKLSKSGQYAAKKAEHAKSSIRAKVEHVFGVVKKQLLFRKTRYRGLQKQQAKFNIMFALANLILADRPCLVA